MIYCPRQFVLNLCGLTLLMLVAAAVARDVLGLGAVGLLLVLSAPAVAAGIEGGEFVRTRLTVPHPTDMWRAAYHMAVIYVQIVFVLIIAIIIFYNGQEAPNILNIKGVLSVFMTVGAFLGLMTLCLRFGFWCGVQNALNQLKA